MSGLDQGSKVMTDTKERIFDEATRLFAEKGYSLTTVREIGAAAGISDSVIYRYFTDKAAILDGVLERFLEMLKGYLLTSKQVDTLIDTLSSRELLNRCFPNFRKEDTEFMLKAYRVLFMEQLTNEKAAAIVTWGLHDESAHSVQYILDRLIDRGEIPDFDTQFFSRLWARAMFSLAMSWMSCPNSGISDEYYDFHRKMVNMAVSGHVPAKDDIFFTP